MTRIPGSFLGDFTNGYTLDSPTKTVVGPDGMLYVSQWGAAQNRVVRFELQSGDFIDEFTAVGVPQGCGTAWNGDGELLVASWGEGNAGFVQLFDPQGADLGVFIPTGDILGPTNIWTDIDNTLMVADWSQGTVFRYDLTDGTVLETVATGLTTVEGYTYDELGRLYLGDWSQSTVHRFDLEAGMSEIFVTAGAGGLDTPNSVVFGPCQDG